MIMDTLGHEVDLEQLVKEGTQPGQTGMAPYQVVGLLKTHGVTAIDWTGRNIADLARYIAHGKPVIAWIANKATGFSHWVVVDGVTSRSGIEVVAVRDPWGKQYFSPTSTFGKYFTGSVVVPWPYN